MQIVLNKCPDDVRVLKTLLKASKYCLGKHTAFFTQFHYNIVVIQIGNTSHLQNESLSAPRFMRKDCKTLLILGRMA